MRINTNTAAMNTYSNLTSANASKSNSLAKLSSGLRINKAGDDAAGLAISEKMKNQISGMTQASRNAQDGISLIQTAEGGLTETHSILNRMRDLAVQAKNDTNTDEDKGAIQKEMDSLSSEIGRISKDTQFNSKSLLDGGAKGTTFNFQIGANAGQAIELSIKDMSTNGLGLTSETGLTKEAATKTAAVKAAASVVEDDAKVLAAQKALDEAVDGDALATPENVTGTYNAAKLKYDEKLEAGTLDKAATEEFAEAKAVYDKVVSEKDPTGALRAEITTTKEKAAKSLVASVEANKVAVANEGKTEMAISSKLKVSTTEGETALTAKDYDNVIETIDSAIKLVSEERANLGAVQNRLDHTVSNLATTKENLSEANSRITDVDMAEEMMSFTKSNILSQASTSMLAQANQMPQSVLSLLQ
ncbi:flagellin [Desemzia sp. FAM 23989]|uniref:flagellin N-terminal helical domain-containing protein n=1 Tax=Desemzia sp. FAM 23989 TaxID=3259523 RepID=UPI003884FE8F